MFRSTIPLTEVPFHHAIIPLLNLYRLTLSDSLLCVCVWGGGACVNSMNTCQLTDSHPQFSDEDDNDDEDNNEFACSDDDGDTCEDCSDGSYGLDSDGWDYDGDGQCDQGDGDDERTYK